MHCRPVLQADLEFPTPSRWADLPGRYEIRNCPAFCQPWRFAWQAAVHGSALDLEQPRVGLFRRKDCWNPGESLAKLVVNHGRCLVHLVYLPGREGAGNVQHLP
jgi:hypothetical protein